MSGKIARGRLAEERKSWRKNHPYGFVARPEIGEDGSVNLMMWHCYIPGKLETVWEGGCYPITMQFSEDYPSKPPKCKFPQGFFHPNVYPSGTICLSILNEDSGWSPTITVKQILLHIQDLLDQPDPNGEAQTEGYELYMRDTVTYKRRVKHQAKQYAMDYTDKAQTEATKGTRPGEIRRSGRMRQPNKLMNDYIWEKNVTRERE